LKTALRFTVVLLLIGVCVAATSAADSKPIAIVHARLIDGMGGTPVEDATVLVRGKTIEYAGPAAGASVPKDAQIIDASGKTVMPGWRTCMCTCRAHGTALRWTCWATSDTSMPCFTRA
jgi:hypothetical protein